jgi:mono/diheme cytochrome c family protein
MKRNAVLALSAFVLIGSASLLVAQDGAVLYKSKCAGCHGKDGEGKSAMKAPALKGTTWDSTQIAKHLTQGEPTSKPPHNKGIAGLTDEQAKAIGDFIQSLK